MDISIFNFRHFVSVVLVLGLFSKLDAQKWTPQHYNGISPENFKEVFHDRFDDNDHDWNDSQFAFNAQFEDRGLLIKSLVDVPTHYSRIYEFNKGKNYQISTTLSFQKSTGAAGIALGMDSNGNGYMFMVQEGVYQLLKMANGIKTVLQKSVYPVSTEGNISLSIRKIDDAWYFFINKNAVLHLEAQSINITSVGWALENRANILVDDLLIENIEVSDTKGPIISILSSEDIEKRGKQKSTAFLCNKNNLFVTGFTNDQYGVKEINVETSNQHIIDHQIVENNRDGIKFRFNLNLIKDSTHIVITSIDNYDNASVNDFWFILKKTEPKIVEVSPTIIPQPEQETRFIPSTSNQKYRNVAVFIGVNQYQHWGNLNNAVYDCNSVSDVLAEEYQFDRQNMIKLYNSDVTRQNVMELFDSLQRVLSKNDNLIVYYAGHGHYNEDSKFGYWVPSEAREDKPSDYLSNNDIKAYLGAIQTKHTLVIADACFAGSLMRGNANAELLEDAFSRWVISSGDLENVDDGIPGQNSPFAASVIRALKTNQRNFIRADELFRKVDAYMEAYRKQDPARNRQKPKASPIKDIDQGGIFVFRKRD